MITYPTDKLQKVLLAGKCRQGVLPNGYTQVEYLESSGTQYIDTGIVPTVEKETEVRLTFARTSQSAKEGFGSNNNLNVVTDTGSRYNWRLNGTQTTVPIVNNEFVNVILKQTSNGRYYKIKTTEGYSSENESEYTFYLGKLSKIDDVDNYTFKGKYKSCTILENSAIVRNLIPARRKSDNVLGMYDTVTGDFLTNDGTGTFIAGPDIVYTTPTCEYGEPVAVSAKPTEVVRIQATDYAPVKSMKGNTVKWNQLVSNGDFSNGISGWDTGGITNYNIKNGFNYTTDTLQYNHSIYKTINIPQGHKVYVHHLYECTVSDYYRIRIGNIAGTSLVQKWLSKNVLHDIKEIAIAPSNITSLYFRFPDVEGGYSGMIADINLIDLTAIFGAGNEPATVADFESWLSTNIGLKDYYPYDAGSLLSVNTPSTVINGEEYPFPITTITDINGTVMFPNGLCQADIVKDSIDFENGVAVKKVGRLRAKNATWILNGVNDYGIANFATSIAGRNGQQLMSYKYNKQNTIISVTQTEGLLRADNTIYLRVQSSRASNTTELQTLLNSEDLIIYYELATPVEYTLSVKGAVPTPDVPIDIWCNNGVLKVTQNLIDFNAVTNGYYYDQQGNYGSSEISRLTDYIPIKAGQSVTVYFKSLSPTVNLNVRINIFNSNKAWQRQEVLQLAPEADGIKIITPTANGYIRVSGNYANSAGTNADWDTAKIVYGEYTVDTINSAISKIYPDGTQEVVTDNLGNTANAERLLAINYYKDTHSVLDGKVTRNVGIKVLDGTEEWFYDSTNLRFHMGLPLSIAETFIRSIPAYCSHFVMLSHGEPIESITSGEGYISSFRLFLHSPLTTTESFKQFLADQYAAGTPVIIVYPIATATTEQVTPQPLAGNTATITAGSIDNLPIESSTITELKKRYIGDKEVQRVYIGENLVWESN